MALTLTSWWSATALAQLDPLLFIKRVPPTVIIVMDTSVRMLEDGAGTFYDPSYYRVTDDPTVMGAFSNINTSTTKSYRRTYRNLQYVSPGKYSTDSITATAAAWDPANPLTSGNAGDAAYLDPTRYSIAKLGVKAAVGENAGSAYRWGLIRLRQLTPSWRVSPSCDFPVAVGGAQAGFGDLSPCNAGGLGNYAIYAPTVAAASFAQATAPAGTVMVIPAGNTASAIVTIANRNAGDNGGFVPAGLGGVGYDDRPLKHALDDAKAAAITAMGADTAASRPARNTVVVLITSGKDSGDNTYLSGPTVDVKASSFLSVTGGSSPSVTKRVPIVVIGVMPAPADEAQLQAIATNSGGFYRNVTSVEEVTAAVNRAVQLGFVRQSDFDGGRPSEFLPVSPVIGTVNLEGASDATGLALTNTDITAVSGGPKLAQRSNFMLTAGFSLPGFDGSIRAFRTYKPVIDSTKSTGWKFASDGTRLWPDLDGQPLLAGMARTVKDPGSRNIYTFLPNGSGGGSTVAFTTANAAALATHLGSPTDAAAVMLITSVRAQPLGAVIGSTPGLMDAPSLDPPPDVDYGFPASIGTFAGDHKDRRSVLFVGANDGMIHAIDARTGYEVWAFIPYNLLPKLRTLLDGQPVEQFDYFVDSSPKLAEVKLNGEWRSLLIMGEGSGGTFYQAFDVTEVGMGVAQDADGLSAVNAMLARFDTPDESIVFKWAYPNYSSFNPAYTQTFTVSDGTSGGKVKLFGDLKSTASYAEKTVGFTWSDPAVGPLDTARTTNAVIVGSGYFPDIETLIPARGASAPKAGNALYLLDAGTGTPIGNASGSSCPTITSGSGSGSGCVNVGDVSNGRKNALQADPSAATSGGSAAVSRAYLGDTDGKYWRFAFTSAGSISAMSMVDTDQPIYASSALLFIGSSDIYTFFATGSDLLPVTAPGGIGTFKLYGLKDNYPSNATVKFTRSLSPVTNVGGIANGERPSASPSVAGDIVFFTTTVETASAPAAVSARLYGLTYTGSAAYDTDGNGKLDNNESPIAATLAGRATAPFIVDQHLYFGTTGAAGANLESFGDPEDFNNGIGQVGVRILSWREIR